VGQLDHDRGLVDLGPVGLPQLGGEQRQHGSHPLAARQHQVTSHVVGERVGLAYRRAQACLDPCQTGTHLLVEHVGRRSR
jgi:hypothetical protein